MGIISYVEQDVANASVLHSILSICCAEKMHTVCLSVYLADFVFSIIDEKSILFQFLIRLEGLAEWKIITLAFIYCRRKHQMSDFNACKSNLAK